MREKIERIIVSLLFLLSFGFRLFFSLRIPFFSSDSAYFHLHHAEFIRNHITPLFYNPMSYGGNTILNTHLFHYVLALFDLIFSQSIAYKVLPALLASTVVFIVYFFAKEMTKDSTAALTSALLAAFIPIYIRETTNQISLMSLFVPAFLLLLYTFLNLTKSHVPFLILSFFVVLLNPLNLLPFITFLLFVMLLLAESLEVKKEEKEALGLFLFLFLLINLIFFKNLYLEKGLAAVWQNLPPAVYGEVFQNFNLFETIAIIGIAPLVLGVIGFIVTKKKDKTTLLCGSVLLAAFALLLFKLIPFNDGVLILAMILAIMSAPSVLALKNYVRLTKFDRFFVPLALIFFLLSSISVIIPAWIFTSDIITNGVNQEEVDALTWIKENTPQNSVVVANPDEGNMIITLAERTNVIDSQFLLADDRIGDIKTLFQTESIVKAVRILDKYGINYIYFSTDTARLYKTSLVYTQEENCFTEVFRNNAVVVYQVLC